LGQNCKIVYRQAIIPSFFKAISEGGIGLLCVPFLHADDIVTVELENGRRPGRQAKLLPSASSTP
jgi:hypothetical protein